MKKLLLALFVSVNLYAQLAVNTPPDNELCDTNNDGFEIFDLTISENYILNGLNPDDYSISYHETEDDAFYYGNPITDPVSYQNINSNQAIYVRVTDSTDDDNFELLDLNLIVNPTPVAPDVSDIVEFDTDGTDDQVTEIDFITLIDYLTTSDDYTVTLHLSEQDAFSGTNVIPGQYSTGTATLYFRIENMETGCYTTGSFGVIVLHADYYTPIPTGETVQTFSAGQTLADLQIEGENINWYATETAEDTLPMDTVLEDETMYYATQTLNTIESIQRLAVTATQVLNTDSFSGDSFTYYPNPVSATLYIDNLTAKSTVEVYNQLGQLVITKEAAAQTTLDMSGLANGIYMVNIQVGDSSKTVKIVKN